MRKAQRATGIRKYWLLIVIAGVAGLVVAGKVIFGDADPPPIREVDPRQPVLVELDTPLPTVQPKRPTPKDEALEIIADYEKKLNAEEPPEDKPALIFATGNLYRQKLRDYAKAVEYYRWILQDYPDSTVASTAYVQLITCYEQLGDTQSANDVHYEIMKRYPEDSQEHKFAKSKLGWD
jgi:tetratricopeptide (TPR) repeat protein